MTSLALGYILRPSLTHAMDYKKLKDLIIAQNAIIGELTDNLERLLNSHEETIKLFSNEDK